MQLYKKILRIKYRNKLFDVFLTSLSKKVFLEVKKQQNKEYYVYPQLSDYIGLSMIYNQEEDILYSKKYHFTERLQIATVAGIIAISGLVIHKASNFVDKNYQIDKHNPSQLVQQNEEINYSSYSKIGDTIYIYHNDALTNFGFKEISFHELRENVELNNKLKDSEKEYIKEYINALEERLPEIDLRILNENIKTLEIETIPNEEWDKPKVEAYYEPNLNKIYVKESYDSIIQEKEVYYHELGHVLNNGNMTYMDPNTSVEYRLIKRFYTDNNYGKSFSEGFNTILTQYLLTSDWQSYFQNGVHRYNAYQEVSNIGYQILMLNGNYNIYDYLNGNVTYLYQYLQLWDLEDLIAVLDTTIKTDSSVTIIDDTELANLEKKLLNQFIKQQLSSNQSDIEVYQGISNFILNYNQKYDICSEILNQDRSDWTIRINTPKEKERDGIRTTIPEVSIFDSGNNVCQTSINNLIIYSTYQDEENQYHFGLVDYSKESLQDVVTKEIVNIEDMKETMQLKTILNQFYLYDISMNTTILDTQYFQNQIKQNICSIEEESLDSNHIIK